MSMYSQFPKVMSYNDIFQIWEVPFDFYTVTTYKDVVVYKSEIEEARTMVGLYGIDPIVRQRGETELWSVPSSCPMPNTKDKQVNIPKNLVHYYYDLFMQKYKLNPRIVDLGQDFDVWVVPADF